MRFEVPQFIEIEDKIFGPFTWRQFLYLGGGALTGIATYFFHIIAFVLIGLPAIVFALLLSFYPINNRPFSIFFEAMVQFYRSDKVYYWRRKSQGVYRNLNNTSDAGSGEINNNPPKDRPVKGNSNITSLTRKLELEAMQKDDKTYGN